MKHDDVLDAFVYAWTHARGFSNLHSRRKHRLLQAMRMAGIGKGWRNKVRAMASEDLARFEAKLRFKATDNQQWAEAQRYFTAMQVAAALEGKQ